MTLLAPAREPDRLVHGSSDCGMEGRATLHARWSAALPGVGDHQGADAAGGTPPIPAQTMALMHIGQIRRWYVSPHSPDEAAFFKRRHGNCGLRFSELWGIERGRDGGPGG